MGITSFLFSSSPAYIASVSRICKVFPTTIAKTWTSSTTRPELWKNYIKKHFCIDNGQTGYFLFAQWAFLSHYLLPKRDFTICLRRKIHFITHNFYFSFSLSRLFQSLTVFIIRSMGDEIKRLKSRLQGPAIRGNGFDPLTATRAFVHKLLAGFYCWK